MPPQHGSAQPIVLVLTTIHCGTLQAVGRTHIDGVAVSVIVGQDVVSVRVYDVFTFAVVVMVTTVCFVPEVVMTVVLAGQVGKGMRKLGVRDVEVSLEWDEEE